MATLLSTREDIHESSKRISQSFEPDKPNGLHVRAQLSPMFDTEAQLEDTDAQLKQARAEITRLNKKLKSLELKPEQAQAEITQLNEKLKSFELELEHARAEKTQLNEKLKSFELEIRQLNEKLKSFELEIRQLNEKLKSFELDENMMILGYMSEKVQEAILDKVFEGTTLDTDKERRRNNIRHLKDLEDIEEDEDLEKDIKKKAKSRWERLKHDLKWKHRYTKSLKQHKKERNTAAHKDYSEEQIRVAIAKSADDKEICKQLLKVKEQVPRIRW